MLCLHQNKGQQDRAEVYLDFVGDVDQRGVEVHPMPFSVPVPCYYNFPYFVGDVDQQEGLEVNFNVNVQEDKTG